MRAVGVIVGGLVAIGAFGCSSNPGPGANEGDVDAGSFGLHVDAGLGHPMHDAGGNPTPEVDSGSPGNPGTDSGGASTDGVAPVIGGCTIFPDDNAWNTRIDDATKFPVHAQNATYLASMHSSTTLHPDWGTLTEKYGIPWQTVGANQALVPMKFDESDQSDPGPYPFPATALIEEGDGHVLVLDTATCMLYETYASKFSAGGWSCSSGAKFNLMSNTLRPDGWTSADAAGLSVFAGLVKLSEVQAGAIHHAIRFSVSSTQNGYIHPATHAAGNSGTSLPPMGLRMRLKASFSLAQFSGASLVIATAMQQYGIILADNGSNWYITGDSDNGWSSLMDGIVTQIGKIKGSDFEAVQTGSISTAGL